MPSTLPSQNHPPSIHRFIHPSPAIRPRFSVQPTTEKVMDTFGCTPKFLAENPKAAKALADGYFDALDLLRADPAKSNEIMGSDVKQSGEAFAKSASYLRWQDRAANQKFFAGEHAQFSKEAADLLLEMGIIKSLPDMSKLADTRFLK